MTFENYFKLHFVDYIKIDSLIVNDAKIRGTEVKINLRKLYLLLQQW